MVEVTGLEPTASASRTQRSTKLSHPSIYTVSNTALILYNINQKKVKGFCEIFLYFFCVVNRCDPINEKGFHKTASCR